MPDFPLDTKSFFAGLTAGQALKGRARSAIPPPPDRIPLEYLEPAPVQTLPPGNSANNPGWTFDQSAFCLGLAAGRALEGWKLDAVAWKFKGNVVSESTWWTLYDNGLLYIYCDGDMPPTPREKWYFRAKKIFMADSVTSISDRAFFWCGELEGPVTIPDSVTTIGEEAFYGCTSLTAVTIPDSVTSIGNYAFYECRSLKEITIPGSIATIRDNAFSYCTHSEKVTLGDGVTVIERSAFDACFRLKTLIIPASVTTIGKWAFDGVNNADVYYAGTQEQWKQISVGDGNGSLRRASWYNSSYWCIIHYNSTGPDDVHD